MASVDFSKAFDSVWHSALFHKLLSLKLPPCFVLWVRSFLSDHRAKVQVGGSRSLSFRIRRGVLQGTVLGPVLFILFVDDITKDLPRGAHASLYADDLAIGSSFPDPLKASSVVVQFLCSKFYPRLKALRSIATASWGPTKESFSLLCKAFVQPVLTYASPGWFPFLCNTATNYFEILHKAACRVIIGCLSSTPSSLLLLEAQLPPLKLTLEHQALSSFERALHLPPDFSSFYALAKRNVPCRLKKKPFWRSICSSATQSLPSPSETLIMCPPFSPMDCNPLHRFPLHSRLHRQQYSPTPVCFKQTIFSTPF